MQNKVLNEKKNNQESVTFQCTMWNLMKLAAQIRIAWGGGRQRNGAPRSNVFTSRSPVANPKSGPDYSVFIMK
jgi:hypothetical protein